MREHPDRLLDEIRPWLRDATVTVLVGIGNTIRSDDGAGVVVVQRLEGRVPPSVHLIVCETVPESVVDEIVALSPTHVLLIDAALLGHPPGTAHLYAVEEVSAVPGISTHALPLRIFSDYVVKLTGARLALVLIEPRSMDFGEGLSEAVCSAVDGVVEDLLKVLHRSDR